MRRPAVAGIIDGKLRKWVNQYTAKHGQLPSRHTIYIYLMGQEIAKDTRRMQTTGAPQVG